MGTQGLSAEVYFISKSEQILEDKQLLKLSSKKLPPPYKYSQQKWVFYQSTFIKMAVFIYVGSNDVSFPVS